MANVIAETKTAAKFIARERVQRDKFFGYFVGAGDVEFPGKDGKPNYTRPAIRLKKLHKDEDFNVVVTNFVVEELLALDEDSLSNDHKIEIYQFVVGQYKNEETGQTYNNYRYKVVNATTKEIIIDFKPNK